VRVLSLNFKRRYFIPTVISTEKVPVSVIQGASRGIGFEFVSFRSLILLNIMQFLPNLVDFV